MPIPKPIAEDRGEDGICVEPTIYHTWFSSKMDVVDHESGLDSLNTGMQR